MSQVSGLTAQHCGETDTVAAPAIAVLSTKEGCQFSFNPTLRSCQSLASFQKHCTSIFQPLVRCSAIEDVIILTYANCLYVLCVYCDVDSLPMWIVMWVNTFQLT